MARHPKRQQPRNTLAIVGDGETERIYFYDVRDTDRPENLAIFPDVPKKTGSYKGVLGQAIALSESYDRVYALIDMDKVIGDNQQAAYNQAKAEAEARGIIVLENNPCFEIWFLLHFIHTGHLFNNCNQVSVELRRNGRILGYEKTGKFLKNARLYQTYRVQLRQQAIPHARLLENNREDQDQLFPRAQIFQFFEWYFENG